MLEVVQPYRCPYLEHTDLPPNPTPTNYPLYTLHLVELKIPMEIARTMYTPIASVPSAVEVRMGPQIQRPLEPSSTTLPCRPTVLTHLYGQAILTGPFSAREVQRSCATQKRRIYPARISRRASPPPFLETSLPFNDTQARQRAASYAHTPRCVPDPGPSQFNPAREHDPAPADSPAIRATPAREGGYVLRTGGRAIKDRVYNLG